MGKDFGKYKDVQTQIPLITEIADSKLVALEKNSQANTTHPNVKRIDQTRAKGVAVKEDHQARGAWPGSAIRD